MKVNLLNCVIICIAVAFAICACNKDENNVVEPMTSNDELVDQPLIETLLSATTNNDFLSAMYDEATSSYNAGLEESIYLDEILETESATKSCANSHDFLRNFFTKQMAGNFFTATKSDDVLSWNNIEIYWPYSDAWDGISRPVIVLNHNDKNQYIEADKTYAYKLNETENGYEVETIVVDEAYAETNPVWVINASDVALEDIINLKNGAYDKTNYIPRNVINNPAVATKSSSNVCELVVNTICSTKQHDDWLNGGSEYIIYWFFPYGTDLDKVKNNCTGQIKISRKEIKKGTVRTINFTGNFDWAMAQRYNRVKVIEFDPGAGKDIPIKLSAEVKGVKVTLETSISVNNNDEMVMDYEIYRQSMFTVKTKIDETHYVKSFYGDGVTLETTLEAIEAVAEL